MQSVFQPSVERSAFQADCGISEKFEEQGGQIKRTEISIRGTDRRVSVYRRNPSGRGFFYFPLLQDFPISALLRANRFSQMREWDVHVPKYLSATFPSSERVGVDGGSLVSRLVSSFLLLSPRFSHPRTALSNRARWRRASHGIRPGELWIILVSLRLTASHLSNSYLCTVKPKPTLTCAL